MQFRAQQFMEHAEACEQFARRHPAYADLFRDLALQWRQLAALVRDMAFDSKQATRFFKSDR